MEGDADAQRRFGRPGFGDEGLLQGGRGGDGIRGAGEDGKEAVTLPAAAHQGAGVLLDQGRGESIVSVCRILALRLVGEGGWARRASGPTEWRDRAGTDQ